MNLQRLRQVNQLPETTLWFFAQLLTQKSVFFQHEVIFNDRVVTALQSKDQICPQGQTMNGPGSF